jgi:hypothetical protein
MPWLVRGRRYRRVADTLPFMYAPHEHGQHLCHRVLSAACSGFLTVADIKCPARRIGATREGKSSAGPALRPCGSSSGAGPLRAAHCVILVFLTLPGMKSSQLWPHRQYYGAVEKPQGWRASPALPPALTPDALRISRLVHKGFFHRFRVSINHRQVGAQVICD